MSDHNPVAARLPPKFNHSLSGWEHAFQVGDETTSESMKKHTASDCHLTESSGIFKAHSSQSRPATLTARAGRWFSLPLVLALASSSATSLLAQDVAITGDVDPGTVASPTWDLGIDILDVGKAGTGTLSISGAGAVSSGGGRIGPEVGSTGTVTVSGGSWTNSGSSQSNLIVGEFGNGTLHISGGAVSNDFGVIGLNPGSTGAVTVSGGSWTNSRDILMGQRGGTGTLEISGGAVSSSDGRISNNSTATVSGGSWTNSRILYLDSGTLTINGTGHVISSDTRLGTGFSFPSTLNLDGGMLSTGQVRERFGSGTFNFNGGTLRLTGDQVDLFEGFETGDVTLDAGGGTIDTQAFTVATSLSLDGTGSLTKEGTGSLTLTGANTYSGGTEINGGILRIGADNHLGDASGSLSFDFATLQTTGSFSTSRDTTLDWGGGRFSTDASTTLTHAGAISGPGGLTKEGAGTLVLSGNNDYSGSTTISEGTLSLGSNTAAGTGGITSMGAVLDYADGVSIANQVAIFSNTNQLQVLTGSATQSGAIGEVFGSYDLEKIGDGTLILTGANTYSGDTTISAGTLQIGNGGTTGSIAGDITNNANLAFNRTDDYSFNGTVSGSGNVIQRNGVLHLSAAHTYTGSTVIEGGTLQLDATGSINDSSGIDIASGATFDVSAITGGYILGTSQTLSGNGDIVGNVTTAGMIAPGNSTGELLFTGNLSLVPSSMIQMEIGSLSDFDRIVVSDTLTYGGTLGLAFIDGYIPTVGDNFDLFQGFSSHSGTFEDITVLASVLASGYTTSFDYGTGVLTFTAIPEPSSLVLLGISVFAIALFGRRRPLTT